MQTLPGDKRKNGKWLALMFVGLVWFGVLVPRPALACCTTAVVATPDATAAIHGMHAGLSGILTAMQTASVFYYNAMMYVLMPQVIASTTAAGAANVTSQELASKLSADVAVAGDAASQARTQAAVVAAAAPMLPSPDTIAGAAIGDTSKTLEAHKAWDPVGSYSPASASAFDNPASVCVQYCTENPSASAATPVPGHPYIKCSCQSNLVSSQPQQGESEKAGVSKASFTSSGLIKITDTPPPAVTLGSTNRVPSLGAPPLVGPVPVPTKGPSGQAGALAPEDSKDPDVRAAQTRRRGAIDVCMNALGSGPNEQAVTANIGCQKKGAVWDCEGKNNNFADIAARMSFDAQAASMLDQCMSWVGDMTRPVCTDSSGTAFSEGDMASCITEGTCSGSDVGRKKACAASKRTCAKAEELGAYRGACDDPLVLAGKVGLSRAELEDIDSQLCNGERADAAFADGGGKRPELMLYSLMCQMRIDAKKADLARRADKAYEAIANMARLGPPPKSSGPPVGIKGNASTGSRDDSEEELRVEKPTTKRIKGTLGENKPTMTPIKLKEYAPSEVISSHEADLPATASP